MLFDMLDTNDNNQIEFSEFKAAMMRSCIFLNDGGLRKAFHFFDKDNSGYISRKELCCVFSTFEDLFSLFDKEDYDRLIDEVDSNQDGRISYQEFVVFMTSDLNQCEFHLPDF